VKSSIRVLAWAAAGTTFGLCLSACAGALERYPLINTVLWFLAPLLSQAMSASGLAPHGEAGFVIIPIAMVLQWTILGFLGGLCYEWRLGQRGVAPSPIRETGNGSAPAKSPLGLRLLFTTGAVLVLVAGYCAWQEIVLSRDREFFLRHVDHKAVAEACFDILRKPEKELWPMIGLYSGSDARLPPAIRRLEPKAVAIHIDDIGITKTPRHFYNSLEFRQNTTDKSRYDLVYVEGPDSSNERETVLYSMFAGGRQSP
jgi:hypothetical protein